MDFRTLKNKRITAAANTTAIVVKPSPGGLYGWQLFNNSAAKIFVKLYNAAATVGTTTPILTIGIPAGVRADVVFDKPMYFDTAINVGITTGITDGDTTAPAANDVIGQIIFL
jgi:hypothetical protein